jgi:adenosylmethionine-8-amino-7-oxononanoate aminotransferase
LIFDEIITGMGRTGNWFAAQTFGVAPDILCCGKGMASGYAPLSAMIVRDDLYQRGFWDNEAMNPGFSHGHTFGGNPISAAAGLAVIDVIERDGLLGQGQHVGQHIRERLAADMSQLSVLGEVRGVGALSCIELVANMQSKEPFPPERKFGKRVESRSRAKGLLLRCDPNWIAIAPPLTTTMAETSEILKIIRESVYEELHQKS